ncbi:MAG: hypothetical protein AVDCRST_MAG13-2811 [uncultured Solirubrobacteraceae bacterium]|uniref:Cytochrome c domain-containing protein n=1 Tax=uncultured Solirubrobacteraceae bacterium TaxID=1162706 RepID=A0A6J4T0Z1_9ACTN|nr:MAG: hypothetical protein AVDCRST_MAG13-2811 [uncultured Solirubrobacteraceae bacterium]
MNQREKEQYLREYALLKQQGKPFFPYAVAKDSLMAVVTMAVIVVMAIVLGAELGPKADPTTTTYTPRPEWYFYFLFELLPFYDRGPERRPERRPVATTAGILTIIAMGYLTYLGAEAGPPTQIDMPTPARIEAQGGQMLAEYNAGKQIVAQSGCQACHVIGHNGNDGPGPPLTDIAARLPRQAIARTLINPTAPMPSYLELSRQDPEKFDAMVAYLAQLKGEEE